VEKQTELALAEHTAMVRARVLKGLFKVMFLDVQHSQRSHALLLYHFLHDKPLDASQYHSQTDPELPAFNATITHHSPQAQFNHSKVHGVLTYN
jgi:hypothetical protein